MIERLWAQPKLPAKADILAEERERRQRRGRWQFLWPGSWLYGKVGVVVLGVFIVGGLAWAGYQGVGGGLAQGAEPSVEVVIHPEAGRGLTAVEYAAAERFGVPLELGEGGLPLIRVKATGEVREVTPVELEYHSSRPFLESEVLGVVWNPGPRGWGMWWRDNSEMEAVRTQALFPRLAWAEKQERELAYAAWMVSEALRLVSLMDLEVWRPGLGPVVLELTSRLRSRYPQADYGEWGLVPLSWQCDPGLESDLHQGITQGCPGPEYLTALESAWTRVGVVVAMLEGIGRLAERMDNVGAAELYQSDYLLGQTYLMVDVLQEVEALGSSLERLLELSVSVELPVNVHLFREPL